MTAHLRLGVNIDHVATLRNARGGTMPDPLRAVAVAAAAGADGVTAHLREDRRHISDQDIHLIRAENVLPLNLEMAATDEMVEFAVRARPAHACIVPERREELTTEGGLDVVGGLSVLIPRVAKLIEAGIQVALFIDPDPHQVEAAQQSGAHAVELHTGEYCNASAAKRAVELARLQWAAVQSVRLGLECHAGHGLTVENVWPVACIPEVIELNIGHSIVAEAVFGGLGAAIRDMRAAMDRARTSVA